MAVRGEKPWPYAGRNRDRSRGYLMAAYGEKPMAIDNSGLKLIQRYVACCESAAQDPDPELMARFVAVLQSVGLIEEHDERS
jgi:hypothetical protein